MMISSHQNPMLLSPTDHFNNSKPFADLESNLIFGQKLSLLKAHSIHGEQTTWTITTTKIIVVINVWVM